MWCYLCISFCYGLTLKGMVANNRFYKWSRGVIRDIVLSDIFRPQTRRVGEITVLYTQFADQKLGVNCVHSIETIALFLSTDYLYYYKTCSPTLSTPCTPDFFKVCIYKVVARASGMGARNKFYLVWHLCTNHGAHIFT
jgi:hypothetical protein